MDIRGAFDTLAQLGVTRSEYAALLYAALWCRGDHAGPLAEAMRRPELLHLFKALQNDVDAWLGLAEIVSGNRDVERAVLLLAENPHRVPAAWPERLPTAKPASGA